MIHSGVSSLVEDYGERVVITEDIVHSINRDLRNYGIDTYIIQQVDNIVQFEVGQLGENNEIINHLNHGDTVEIEDILSRHPVFDNYRLNVVSLESQGVHTMLDYDVRVNLFRKHDHLRYNQYSSYTFIEQESDDSEKNPAIDSIHSDIISDQEVSELRLILHEYVNADVNIFIVLFNDCVDGKREYEFKLGNRDLDTGLIDGVECEQSILVNQIIEDLSWINPDDKVKISSLNSISVFEFVEQRREIIDQGRLVVGELPLLKAGDIVEDTFIKE